MSDKSSVKQRTDESPHEKRKKLLKKMLQYRKEWSYAYQKFLNTPREYFPGEKMYMREVHVIMEIGESGIENVSELSERLDITKGAVSQYLSRLEKKKFIQRIQDQTDKRQFSVKLTQKGQELYRYHTDYDEIQYGRACALFSDFNDDELEIAFRLEQEFRKFSGILLEEPEGGAYGKNGEK